MGTRWIMLGFCVVCVLASGVGMVEQLSPGSLPINPWSMLFGAAFISAVQLLRTEKK